MPTSDRPVTELPAPELAALVKMLAYRRWSLTLAPSVPAIPWALHIITPPEPGVCDHFVYVLPPRIWGERATVGADRFWLEWLHRMFIKVELHQTDERFVLDGVKPFDPHQPAVKAPAPPQTPDN